MGISRGKKIITDGLIFHIDAANTRSYPGTGTILNDISGNGSNGVLTNGPTFDSSNNGSIQFDGVNDYVDCGEFNTLTTNFTFELWIKPIGVAFNTILTGGPTLDESSALNTGFYFVYDNRETTNYFYIYVGGYTRITNIGSFNPIEGTTYQISICGNASFTNFYANGSLIQSTTGGINFGSLDIQHLIIGARRYYNGVNAYVNVNTYSTKIYNRALSSDEVLQNYNATKGRFGL